MNITELLDKYNKQLGNIVSDIRSASEVDFCSLSDVIDNNTPFGFKVTLFPPEAFDQLLSFSDDTFFNELSDVENLLTDYIKQIAFYPKFNTTFETFMHVPILNKNAISASDEIKSVFEIPIAVKYYLLFNKTITTVKRYYNSNVYFDHTGYGLIPPSILDRYNFFDLFTQNPTAGQLYPDEDIQQYGLDFTSANVFSFIVDDPDIRAQNKNIAFMEICLDSNIKNFLFYVMQKKEDNVILQKGRISNLYFRKVFYNVDFMNIKNRIVKYND